MKMTEDKKAEEPEEQPTEEGEALESKTASALIDKANKAAERLEEANKTLSGLLEEQRLMKVEQTMGGQAKAGSQKKTKEETDKDNARAMLEGTGYETMFDEPDPRKK